MRFTALVFLTAVAFSACQELKPDKLTTRTYFDLDSLIKYQVRHLSSVNPKVIKTVRIDGQEEQQVVEFDSAGWAQELAVVRDLDLNVPRYQGAILAEESEFVMKYTPKEDQNIPVSSLIVEINEEGQTARLTGTYLDNKARIIYSTSRNYDLRFNNGVLASYEISGFQKMVMSDTTRFSVGGVIQP